MANKKNQDAQFRRWILFNKKTIPIAFWERPEFEKWILRQDDDTWNLFHSKLDEARRSKSFVTRVTKASRLKGEISTS